MKWISALSYRTFYFRSIAALIIGIVALFVPHDTLNTLVRLIGIFILLAGLATAYSAYKASHNILLSLSGIAAIVSIILGSTFITRPDIFIKIIVVLFGVLLVFVGLLQIVNVSTMKTNTKNRKFFIIGGLIPLLVGGAFLLFPRTIEDIIGILLGITLITYALNELGIGFRMRKSAKQVTNDSFDSFEEVKE